MDESNLTEISNEPYTQFGLAMYHAQVLEYGIVNAIGAYNLSAQREQRQQVTASDIEGLWAKAFKGVLGTLIAKLRVTVDIPPPLEDQLDEALRIRNWLAHGYFRDRMFDLPSVEGRNKMVQELKEAVRLFAAVDGDLELLVKPVWTKLDVTDEKVRAEHSANMAKIGVDVEKLGGS
jgi:hypothetical protein